MEVISDLFTIDLLRSGIRLGTPIILAALGGGLCNQAGVLNLVLEGKMLLGAFVGIFSAFVLGSSYGGVLVAGLAGGLLGALFAWLHLRYRVDLVILAIAINLLILDMTVFLMRIFFQDVGTWSDPSINQLPDLHIPGLVHIPVLGDLLSGHNAVVYFSWLAAGLIYFLLFYTKFGRHLRAVGRNQEAAESVGINVHQVKVFVLVISGVLCGIGGSFLSIGHLTLFTRNMTNGRGWIAVTAALFGRNHPIGVFLAGGLFGFSDAFAVRLQTTTNIPPSLVQFIPHVLTLIVLILVGLRSRLQELFARWAFQRQVQRELGQENP